MMSVTLRAGGAALLALLAVLTSQPDRTQAPPIGIIDFYGLRTVSPQPLRQALRIREGDVVPDSLDETRARLEALPGVNQARLTAVCCETGKTIVYVGIKENSASFIPFRPAPQGAVRLPDEVMKLEDSFSDALWKAVQRGDAGEDDSRGHSLSHDPEARALQERFIEYAGRNLDLPRAVLHDSSSAVHRAVAAQIIGYAPNKRDVVNDLADAMRDPDAGVRNNAMRALALIARFAQSHAGLDADFPSQVFVDLLSSIEWTDRNKSAMALIGLTEKRDPELFLRLRRSSIPSLAEMARWRNPGHAYAPFLIMARVAGLSEEDIQTAWNASPHELAVGRLLAKLESQPVAGQLRVDAKGIEQVWIPAGSFSMGTDPATLARLKATNPPAFVQREFALEEPLHEVRITRGYWIDKYEVTQKAFQAFVESGGYHDRAYWSEAGWEWLRRQSVGRLPRLCGMNGSDKPAVCVTWFEAEAYARWRGARLPTEAEWEYAARGPKSLLYPWGNDFDAGLCNVVGSSGLAPVGSYPAGASWVGANDMAGNAMEWVQDWLDQYGAEPVVDPRGPLTGKVKVEKGGWWGAPALTARSAYRHFEDPPEYGDHHIGFRVVSSPITP
ncbi:MAG: hypothetical protein EHM23_17120 [Acidobacteria bacterium]|nr:MAG: hypothetical protein EHM23_17120 [Acidobacteriota bacterium]